jgi:N-acylneuraminate cytidylyltransferase
VSDRLLAVIPARAGSKRIPRKNVRPLAGRPLIVYSIAAALDSRLFSQVVVSTDSEEIAAIARRAGAQVPFLRAADLADDHTPVSMATWDTLRRLDPDGTRYDAVAQLMPNCPMRTAADVVGSYEAFCAGDADAQISVCRFGWLNPWWAMRLGEGGVLTPMLVERVAERSQDQPDLVCPTGAVWWARATVLAAQQTFHVAGRTGWLLPWERALDIDTDDDWRLAEVLAAQPSAGDTAP